MQQSLYCQGGLLMGFSGTQKSWDSIVIKSIVTENRHWGLNTTSLTGYVIWGKLHGFTELKFYFP